MDVWIIGGIGAVLVVLLTGGQITPYVGYMSVDPQKAVERNRKAIDEIRRVFLEAAKR